MLCICLFMGNDKEMPLTVSTAQKVSLCFRLAERETKGECQSDGGSAGRLFLLSQTWDLRRTCPCAPTCPGWTRASAIGAWVSKKKTQIKAWIWWGRVICGEESCLSIPNKTCHYSVLGPLAYANRGKEEGFFSLDRKLCLGRPRESAVDRALKCFCAAELTFIFTDGQSQPAGGKAGSTFKTVQNVKIKSALHQISTKTVW